MTTAELLASVTLADVETEQARRRWRADPVRYVREVFGVTPDAWQATALQQAERTNRLCLKACKGPGKGHRLDMAFDTPSGPRLWGDLVVGDEVFAADGSPTRVQAVYDRGVLPMYRVVFDDGVAVIVDGDHIWMVQGRTERRHGRWATLSTEEILTRGIRVKNGRWQGRQFAIPQQGPAQWPRADLPVDPYVLGVWLGDGGKHSGRFTGIDDDVEHEILRRGYRIGPKDSVGQTATIYGLSTDLRALGIVHLGSHERYVPKPYRTASIAQRLDLLRGLMDTDGSIGTDGHAEFCVTSHRLAEDVAWLTRSLGGAARWKHPKQGWYPVDGVRKVCRAAHRVTVTMPVNPFVCTRKSVRWASKVTPEQQRYLTRYIDKIEPSDPADVRCIEVAHPSKCYLANDFVVTHNTAVLAWLIWHFLDTRAHPRIVATSVSEENLRGNLWRELAKWQGRSPRLRAEYEWTATRVSRRGHKATWNAEARSWSRSADTTQQADTLAGVHEDHCLFVLDESGSIPQAVMATAEAALATGGDTKIVQAGNPTTLDGPLYRACVTDRALWTVVEITGDPDDPARSPRIDLDWARQQIATYGRDNPWVMVNVLGLFPPSSLNALLGPEEVEAAMRRTLPEDAYRWAQSRIGVDVARYGDDRTVLFPRQGLRAFQPVVMRHAKDSAVSTDIATAVLRLHQDAAGPIVMDATGGWAAGASDVLKASRVRPVEVQFHAPAGDRKYKNRRAEMWFALAEWVKRGGWLPQMPELIGELTTPTYLFGGDGKFLLEPKEQVKARLGRSPDLADALALTFGVPELAMRQAEPAIKYARPTTSGGLSWMQ